MDAKGYEPDRYWSRVLGDDPSLARVAYPDLAESLNAALYAAMRRAVRRGLEAAGLGDGLRGRSACDVGVGSGVWVDLWLRLGAARVAGVDLTESAVRHVGERWPAADVRQANIADGVPFDERFDLVSAMSVLLHITDDERFLAALENVAALVRPEGAVLIMDPVVRHAWWGPPFDAQANSKARSLAEWDDALGRAGLRRVELIPVTALLANPVDTRREMSFRALVHYWALLGAVVGTHERLGAAAGALLTPLDRLVLRVAKNGPSTKLLVARPTQSK